MQKIWVTADTHFGHRGILRMCQRQFASIEEHDDHLLEQINKHVQWNDQLYVIGDFAWGAEKVYYDAIKCKNKHLIIGNHDRAQAGKLFKTVQENLTIKIEGLKFFLAHFPHAFWDSSHYGSMHLYGHVHDRREETLDQAFPGRRSMDVGVDTVKRLTGEFRPIGLTEVAELLLLRPGHDQVEFYKEWERQHGFTPAE